jgi:hypothetical protein
MLAGAAAALAMLPEGSISPEVAAAVAGGIAVLPKIVSEAVSWFRSDEEEEGTATGEYGQLVYEDEVQQAAADALELHERMARVEESVDDLKERLNERILDLRTEVREHAGNHEPVSVGVGNRTTRRGSSSKTRKEIPNE